LQRISGSGDFLNREMMDVPSIPKSPGQIGPRPITATVEVRFAGDVLTLHGRNYSETSQCLHAELVLLFALSATLSRHPQSPSRLSLFHLRSQLKPCRMCAAFLHCVRDKCDDFSVVYDQDDPGPLARNTLLDRYGYRSRQTTSVCDHSGALHT